MQKRDSWEIPYEHRGRVNRHMQRALKAVTTKKFRRIAVSYESLSRLAKIGLWEIDYSYLKQANAGLSKYFEALVSIACSDVLEQIILIGHRQ